MPIPKYSDKTLRLNYGPSKVQYVIVSMLKESLSKAKETLKNKFPKHEGWNDESWWTDMRAGFITEATRQLFGERIMSSVIGPPDHLIQKIALVLQSSCEILNQNESVSLVNLSAIVMNLVKSSKVTSREESPFQWGSCPCSYCGPSCWAGRRG
jgi:hypothetical protein